MEKRSFQKLIMYVSIVLIFIAAVVLVFCAREVKNTTEQVNDTIRVIWIMLLFPAKIS